MVYADASALVHGVLKRPDTAAWRHWLAFESPHLVTAQPAIAQLRADLAGEEQSIRFAAADMLDDIPQLRVSDQALRLAAFAQGVLAPYAALNIGIARANEGILGFATYHQETAAVAHLHGLRVFAPGRRGQWWG